MKYKKYVKHDWSKDSEKCCVCGASDWMSGGCKGTEYEAESHDPIELNSTNTVKVQRSPSNRFEIR